MIQGFNQAVSLTGKIQHNTNHLKMPSMMNLEALDAPKTSFKDTISSLADGLNKEMNKPEKLVTGVLSGDSEVDIHDVMTAMAKAEMSVSVATQITSKVIQAYDKIMQISV